MAKFKEKNDVLVHLCQPPYRFDVDGNGQMIQVAVYRYNGGKPKIGITRRMMREGKMSPSKLGRLSLDEAEYIFGAMNEAITKLKEELDRG